MKTLLKSTFSVLFLFAALQLFAKSETITIKSTIICDMCEDNIKNSLIYEKGVKKITFDLDKKEIYVKYNPAKTSVEKIKLAISKIGYDADDIKADPKAYDKLNACCKKDGKCAGEEEQEHDEEEHHHDK